MYFSMLPAVTLQFLSKEKLFSFRMWLQADLILSVSSSQDNIYDADSTTQEIYEQVARPIVEESVKGVNGTIFAYGQTSSGEIFI